MKSAILAGSLFRFSSWAAKTDAHTLMTEGRQGLMLAKYVAQILHG
jgi:hypothetical protein